MRRSALISAASVSLLVLASSMARADGYERRYAGPAPFSWSGMYVGYHLGGALDKSDVSDPFVDPGFGTSHVFGDKVRSPGPFTGGQIGFNQQFGTTVVGVEADVSWADLDGTNTCFAAGGNFLSATCQVHTNWFGTVAGRLGWAVGPGGRTLLYSKAGLAWVHKDVEMAMNNPLATTTNSSFSQLGWTVGAGLEYALTGSWSAKLEYDFLSFGSHGVATPNAGFFPQTPDGRTVGVSQDMHTLRLGINYRLGGGAGPLDDCCSGSIKDGPGRIVSRGYEFEAGGRYVHGWGRFQKDLAATTNPSNTLISRLTYDGMRTDGGELFARLDTPHNLMIKGFIGFGRGGDGKLNDEDWGIGGPLLLYSNTLTEPVKDRINYGTIDVGYDWLRGPTYKVASFVGYNRFTSNMSGFGCTPIAAFNCVPPVPSTGSAIITEDDTWQSLRLGAAADFMLLPRLKVSGDVAYLPYVRFEGVDNHFFGNSGIVNRFFTESGRGTGTQLEASISYLVTDQFSIGAGARYWAMWTTSGHDSVTFVNPPSGSFGPFQSQYKVEQASVFLQASYKFGETCCAGPLK